jgi:hypothetical protein
MAAEAVNVLSADWPVSPSALERFAHSVDRNEWAPGWDGRSCPAAYPIESEVVKHLHRVMIPASRLAEQSVFGESL